MKILPAFLKHPTTFKLGSMLLLFSIFSLFTVGDVLAQSTMPAGTCTTDPSFNIPAQMQLITTIVDNISCILYGSASNPACASAGSISRSLFDQITLEGTYLTIIRATLSLFVIIYGISFMLGIVQFTYMEFLTRMVKFGLVLVLFSPFAWNFFYNTVGVFFQNGTNFLIGLSTKLALGSMIGVDPNKPFLLVDYSIATAFSSKMFVTMLAMFYTPPYGFIFGILVLMGLGQFVAALFQAVWIYLMSLIIRAFLFGLAPVFIPFILFSKTRHLFDGWLNQLVNSMLQPVLLFTFFAFFSVLIQSAMNNILQVPVCYLPGADIWSGLPSDSVTPHFSIWMNGSWQHYARSWGPTGPTAFPNAGITFPIQIMDVLVFLILAQLAWRFNGISINIAKELSAVSTSFNMPGAFSQMFNPTHQTTRRMLNEGDRAVAAQRGSGGAAGVRQGVGGVNALNPGAVRDNRLGSGPHVNTIDDGSKTSGASLSGNRPPPRANS